MSDCRGADFETVTTSEIRTVSSSSVMSRAEMSQGGLLTDGKIATVVPEEWQGGGREGGG